MQLVKTASVPIEWQDAKALFEADSVDLLPRTVQNYVGAMRRLVEHTNLPLNLIGRMHILQFLQQFDCPDTYNHYLFGIKSVFAWASEFYRFDNPAAKLKRNKRFHLPDRRVVNPDEYRLIHAYHGMQRDTAVFIANTGIRASSFCDAKRFDKDHRTLTVVLKGGKQHVVPLNKEALELFPRIEFPKNRVTVHQRCRTLSEKLHIPLFGPHALRHYFATTLIDKGANIGQVSKLLGHSNVSTTIQFYYHPTDLAGVVDLLDETDAHALPVSTPPNRS